MTVYRSNYLAPDGDSDEPSGGRAGFRGSTRFRGGSGGSGGASRASVGSARAAGAASLGTSAGAVGSAGVASAAGLGAGGRGDRDFAEVSEGRSDSGGYAYRSSGTVYGSPRADAGGRVYEPAGYASSLGREHEEWDADVDDRDAWHHVPARGRGGRHDDHDDHDGWDDHGEWGGALASGRRGRGFRDDDEWDELDRDPPRKQRDVGAAVRTAVRGLGEVLITFGLVVLLFAGYEVYGKSAVVNAAQDELESKLEDSWDSKGPSAGKPIPGSGIARLHIPRLEKKWVVVEGVSLADIKNAPGHYPDTVMPGKTGNFSVAGHRMPAVFWDLDTMKPGDAIILEDSKRWYVYEVTETKIVSPRDVDVVAPVPGKPGAEPTEAMLTLTTCNPKWDNYQRLIVHAKLSGEPLDKSEGDPPQLEE